jgi:AAA ATPase-like protein
MDRVDPPAGRLSIVTSADRGPGRQAGEIRFTGWLGLRALYEATGAPDTGPGRGAMSTPRMVATAFPRGRSITVVGMPARAPRLCGRETETGVLREALDRVARGGQAIVLVEGEAGIGKTRLLEQALTDAAARGMQVAAGRADELEQAQPFGLMAGAFGCVQGSADPRRAAIAGLLSAPRGSNGEAPVTVTSDPGLQFRVVDAFGDLVEAMALSGPVVVGADDLQWADPSSLVTLAAMGRRVADLPVGIIGCLRPVPRAAELDGAVRALQAAGARHLALPPLGAGAVGELVSEMVSAEPGPGLLAEISERRGTRCSSPSCWPPCSRRAPSRSPEAGRRWPRRRCRRRCG